jgi:hypothetical protein
VIVAASAALFCACSIFTSLDGFTGGADAAPDGDRSDASNEAATPADAADDSASDAIPLDASDGAGPRGPNIHPNGTFDTTLVPWGSYQGALTLDPFARSGAKSVRVCTLPATTNFFTVDDGGPIPNTLGGTYRVEVWVHTAPGAATPPNVKLFVRTINRSAGFVVVESTESSGIALDGTWQRLEVTLVTTKPAAFFNVFVGGDSITNGCFLVDDVYVERL